jgi:hypothetical protein
VGRRRARLRRRHNGRSHRDRAGRDSETCGPPKTGLTRSTGRVNQLSAVFCLLPPTLSLLVKDSAQPIVRGQLALVAREVFKEVERFGHLD